MIASKGTLIALCLLAGWAAGDIALRAWLWLSAQAKAWLLRRVHGRMDALKPLMGKLVRHARTGRVGLCVGLGASTDTRWGALRPRPVLMLCFCTTCNRRMLDAEAADNLGLKCAMHAAAMQCMEFPLADECTVAPAADAARYRESLEKGEAS